jgi:phosphate:Na+ symporter
MNPTTITLSPTEVLAWLLTGVFLLLYGVRQVSDALQRIVRGRMQEALTRLSKYPLAPFGIGVVVTALIQSSAAVATLLVELVSIGLLPLSTAIVMVLGANVGSTLVVQLLALRITDHAFELLGLGAAVALFTHRVPSFRRFGRVFFAFALIVLGLLAIGVAGYNIAHNDATKSLLHVLEDDNARLVLVLIGTLLAIILNSSTATIGLVLTLAASGALHLVPALVLMLGANVGTTLLSMLASLNQGAMAGRRLAVVHTGTKVLGAVILLLLISPLADLLNEIWPNDPGTQVALAHMGFNLALAVIFIPFAGLLASLMERFLPEKNDKSAEAPLTCSLDERALVIPEVAQGLATRETLRMADIVTQMFELSMEAFKERPHIIYKRINSMDDQLDGLDAAIKGYLTQLNEEKMTDEQTLMDITLLTVVDDLEAIGDVITKRFMSLARRRFRGQMEFTEEGWQDLSDYHKQVGEALQQVLAALAAHNPELVRRFLARKAELKRARQNFHFRHIRQLRADIPHSRESSAVYLDLLDAISDVLEHAFNIAYALRGRSSQAAIGQFRSLRMGSFVKLNLTNTRPLPEVMNGTDTQQLYGAMNGTNPQKLPETMNVEMSTIKAQQLNGKMNEAKVQQLNWVMNGASTQRLPETMNGKHTQQLNGATHETSTEQLYGTVNGTNPQQFHASSPTDIAQVSEW